MDTPGLGASVLLDPAAGLSVALSGQKFSGDLARELAVARAIQQSLLPQQFPVAPGYGLAGFCQSAREVGGDFYDALPLGEGRVLLAVADVMGKGIPAALFAASLRMLVRSLAARQLSPAELLTAINAQMYPELSSVDMFITAQIAVADTKGGQLQVASAGHCPLLIADQLGETQCIAPEGLPLGIEQNATFSEETIPLSACHCALLYTDGLTEACDARGDLFGIERLEAWLSRSSTKNRTAVELKEDFLVELRGFQGQTVNQDDLTLIVLAREGDLRLPRPGQARLELVLPGHES